MGKGLLAGLESDVLANENVETTIVDGDSVLEEISAGSENIIPEDYVELDNGMTITENITEAIEAEEMIMETIEAPLLEEGTESDFNKATLRLLRASNVRLNNLMGIDSKTGLPTDGLESAYGGYKEAFRSGLEAKEGFLKNLKTKAAAGFKAMLDAIRKFIQKALIYFNGAEKSATKISEILKNKTNEAAEGKDLKASESDKKDIAGKFGAWLMMGGALKDYVTYADMLKQPVVPTAGAKLNLRSLSSLSVPAELFKKLEIEGKDAYSLVSLTGTTIKTLVLKPAKEGETGDIKVGGIMNTLIYVFTGMGDKYGSLAMTSHTVTVDDAAKKVGDAILTIPQLEAFASKTSELAKALKSSANDNYTAAESYNKAIKALKEDETAKGAALEKVSRVATRCALENVSAYMTAMKTMLWASSKFAARYKNASK